MSKLNDSTLKIFKKYRLDTDMSVFGDENKLHDVVKVMDDMVGNQVSSKSVITWFYDSLNTQTDYNYSYTENPTNIKTYTYSYDLNIDLRNVSHVYCYDSYTMKYLCDNMKQDVWLYGLLVDSNRRIIAYVGFIIDTTIENRKTGKNFALYKDANCSIPCSLDDFDFSKPYDIEKVFCISDNSMNSSVNLGYSWTVFFEGGTTKRANIVTPRLLKTKITLPKTGFKQNYITPDSYYPFRCNVLVEV